MTNIEALKIRQHTERVLLGITQALEIAELENPNMAVSADTAALITAFDTATDNIAARIQRLIDKSNTLSADDKAALQGEVDKLNALGQDPANPVPAS